MYINCQAVGITRHPGIVVVIIDHKPPCVSLEAKPGFNCRNHLIDVSI